MNKPRQRPIPVTSHERELLEQQKRRWEESTGDSGDWGKFLGTAILLGLAAAGVYNLARATSRSRQSVDVECPECGYSFVMVADRDKQRAIYTTCPECSEEIVVYLGETH